MSTSGSPGDLIIKVNVEADKHFRRDNFDVYTDVYLTISQVVYRAELCTNFYQAVLGAKLTVKTLDGQDQINVSRGTQHGDKLRLPGKVSYSTLSTLLTL